MKYAVFTSGGKQYKVSEGDIVELEKLKTGEGKDIVFDNVLLIVEDGKVNIGQPAVSGVSIHGKVISHFKAKKIRVAKFKAKSRYRRVFGHRQELTKVQIVTIGKSTAKTEKKPGKAPEVKNQKSRPKADQPLAEKVKSTSKK